MKQVAYHDLTIFFVTSTVCDIWSVHKTIIKQYACIERAQESKSEREREFGHQNNANVTSPKDMAAGR